LLEALTYLWNAPNEVEMSEIIWHHAEKYPNNLERLVSPTLLFKKT
jgi:hypothetical protein